jgi:citrate lyase subunit beta/citryl-CoA lyase
MMDAQRMDRLNSLAQTYLFVPAHDVRKAARAAQSGADAVIFDLEASVPDAMKPEARRAVADFLIHLRHPGGPQLWVRVNSRPDDFSADLEALDWSRADGVVVAQAERAETMGALHAAGARRIIPLIESAAAFGALRHLAQAPAVERFAIGTWDLLLDLGLYAVADPDHSELIWQLRGQLVIASRQAGLQPPIDGIYSDLKDDEGLRKACERAHQLGYDGKLLIHPKQIATARSAFRPLDTQLQFAREVVEAYDSAVTRGIGAIQVQGRIVDLPVVEQARVMLARWAR